MYVYALQVDALEHAEMKNQHRCACSLYCETSTGAANNVKITLKKTKNNNMKSEVLLDGIQCLVG